MPTDMTAPESVPDLMERLSRAEPDLPPRLKQCAVVLRRDPGRVAVSTVADMAGEAGVAPSAVMRFCHALGFAGWSEMQALFRADLAHLRPDYRERLAKLRSEGADGPGRLVADFAEAGHDSLVSLTDSLDPAALEVAAATLAGARVLHLVGLRRAYGVVSYVGYLFGKMGVPSVLHDAAGQIGSGHAMLPGDALLAVTFSPFSAEALEAARMARERGVPLVLLTDTKTCPAAEGAAAVLIARETEVGAFRVPVAAMTLAVSLAVAVGSRRERS